MAWALQSWTVSQGRALGSVGGQPTSRWATSWTGDRHGRHHVPASWVGAVGAAYFGYVVGWAALDFRSQLGGGSGWAWGGGVALGGGRC